MRDAGRAAKGELLSDLQKQATDLWQAGIEAMRGCLYACCDADEWGGGVSFHPTLIFEVATFVAIVHAYVGLLDLVDYPVV